MNALLAKVSKLVSRVQIFHLDVGTKSDPVKQPNRPRTRVSSTGYLDHFPIVFKMYNRAFWWHSLPFGVT